MGFLRHGLWLSVIFAASAWARFEIPPTLTLGDVEFSHDLHVSALELECAACHHETNASGLNVPHGSYSLDSWSQCEACHRKTEEPARSQSCGNCHHDSPTDIADETLSSKVVVHRSCWTCHEVATGQAASRACKSCHRRAGGAP